MSSRLPRRAFAASFVVTIAALPGCRIGKQADHRTLPADTTDTTPRDHRGDGEPTEPTDPNRGEVDHRGDGGTTMHTGGDTVDHRDPAQTDPTHQADPGGAVRPGPVPADVPTTVNAWIIIKRDDGTCAASVETSCSMGRPGSCNPPAPTPYACPANVTITGDKPVHVARTSADAECYVKVDMSACHPGATCNPPPPRKVACPK
ncbi:MAG: hypothetical protein K8W52_12070 [Deltaproteobacteria bacterium]|nr:hypothetical protein [Deltaproteobacteria bacterium]